MLYFICFGNLLFINKSPKFKTETKIENFIQMKRIQFAITALIIIAVACLPKQKKQESTGIDASSVLALAKDNFQVLPTSAENPENIGTSEKIALGKSLYYETQLSNNNTQSCNTCHDLKKYGVDNEPTSDGDHGKRGTRNSPTTLNAALHFAQFWDGRMKDVEEQAGGPMLNADEMGMPDEKTVVSRLKNDENYVAMFKNAFPDDKDAVNFENVRKAIGAFERTLLTPSRFDKFLEGELTALNDKELAGVETFINVGCVACHMGPLLGGDMFQMYPLFGTHLELTGSTVDDIGRMKVTNEESDNYLFKVPSLRNINET